MKRVLVVSDNYELVKHFKNVAEAIDTSTAQFAYCYSAINKAPESLKLLGMNLVDMKTSEHVESIIREYDLVISAHSKQIFPKRLVNNVRCINIHPGLNPHNRGWYPQIFSIINKKPIGCTIHLMDDEIDHAIVFQEEVGINFWDTSLDVYERVVQAEKALIKNHLLDIIYEKYLIRDVNEEGNYNGIKDFKMLAELDLGSQGTLKEHIDLLRALTHGSFNNAYFKDSVGKKIYVRIQLEPEL